MGLLTEDIENKAYEAMVGSKRQKHLVDQDDVLEVVDDGLSVEEVHSGGEPVPVEVLGGVERAGSAGDIGDCNDLLEGDDLDNGNDEDDVDVAHEQGSEEAGDHDEGPDCARPEVGLFLLVLCVLLLLRGGFLQLTKRLVRNRDSGGIMVNKIDFSLTSWTVDSWAWCLAAAPSSLTSLKLDLRPSEPADWPFAFW